MKKFYTLLAAAAVVVSASAQDLGTASSSYAKSVSKNRVAKTLSVGNLMKAPAKAAPGTTLEDLAGEYEWSFHQYLQGTAGGDKIGKATVTIDNAATGAVKVDLAGWEVAGTYDEATKVLTIAANQDLGYNQDNQIQVYLYHREWNSEGTTDAATQGFTDEPFKLTFDGTQLLWREIAGTGDFAGQMIKADLIGIGNKSLGWFLMAGDNTMVKDIPVEDNRTWTSAGKATFQDGWTLPIFGIDQTDKAYHYEVALEKCVEEPNTYRLVDPYHTAGYTLLDYNTSTNVGYIEFNLSDPDHVDLAVVEAGFAMADVEVSKFYCLNTLTYIMGTKQTTKEQAIAAIEAAGAPFTTYKDNVVTVPSTLKSATEGYDNDACFGDQTNKLGGWGWQNSAGFSSNMECKIFLPENLGAGIADIAVDNENAPVEYYNLQGVRLSEPAAGQVVIRRQGTKAEKLYVK